MIYIVEKDTGRGFEGCVEYNGLAWFPVADYKDKKPTEFNSFEDADAVALASSLCWTGTKIRVVSFEEKKDEEGNIVKDEEGKIIFEIVGKTAKEYFFEKEEVYGDEEAGGIRSGNDKRKKSSGKSSESHDTDRQGGKHHQTRRPKRPTDESPKKNTARSSQSNKRK